MRKLVFSCKSMEEIPWFMEDSDFFYIKEVECFDYFPELEEVIDTWYIYHVYQLEG